MTCLTSPTLCHSDCHLRLLSIRNVETPTIQPNTLLDKKNFWNSSSDLLKAPKLFFWESLNLPCIPHRSTLSGVPEMSGYVCIVHAHRVFSLYLLKILQRHISFEIFRHTSHVNNSNGYSARLSFRRSLDLWRRWDVVLPVRLARFALLISKDFLILMIK